MFAKIVGKSLMMLFFTCYIEYIGVKSCMVVRMIDIEEFVRLFYEWAYWSHNSLSRKTVSYHASYIRRMYREGILFVSRKELRDFVWHRKRSIRSAIVRTHNKVIEFVCDYYDRLIEAGVDEALLRRVLDDSN